MPPTTETEVRELRDLITDFREEVRIGLISTKAEIQQMETQLSSDIKAVEFQLSGDIKAIDQKISSLDQRMSSLDDRLKTQDGKIWTVVTILLGAAVTLLVKILGFPNV
jgi:chromosome segregation ATPase